MLSYLNLLLQSLEQPRYIQILLLNVVLPLETQGRPGRIQFHFLFLMMFQERIQRESNIGQLHQLGLILLIEPRCV